MQEILPSLAAFTSAAIALIAVLQTRAERHAAVRPILVIEPDFTGNGFARLRVTNVGPGPALDVEATMVVNPGDTKLQVNRTALGPNATLTFVPHGPLTQRLSRLEEDDVNVRISGRCKNAFGKHVAIDDTLRFKVIVRDLERSGQLTTVDQLARVATAAEDLVRGVTDLASRRSPDAT